MACQKVEQLEIQRRKTVFLFQNGVDHDSADDLVLGNWVFDEPQVPSRPGVLFLYEGPFRLLWVEQVEDLHDVLAQYAAGEAGDFTSALFRYRISEVLGPAEVEQLLEGRLDIESVVSFRIKQLISYRSHVEHDGDTRDQLVRLTRNGAAKQGAPEFVLES